MKPKHGPRSSTQRTEERMPPDAELDRLHQALSEIVQPESIEGWLETPNDAFDGLKPNEVIERGEIDRLWEIVYRLRSGMPG